MAVDSGEVLKDRYRLDRFLREGSAGPVWKARDLRLGTSVAIELLNGAGPDRVEAEVRDRVRQGVETITWPWFSHPHAARVLKYDEDERVAFVVMELVEGETLTERLERCGSMSPEEAAEVTGHVADALEAAHRIGVVHGRLGPEVVLFTGGDMVKLLDLGVGQETWASRGLLSRRPARPGGDTDGGTFEEARLADVRALGALLADLLNGATASQVPETGNGEAARGWTEHRRPAEGNDLERLLRDTLSDDPRRRPESAGAFAAAVRAAAVAPTRPDAAPAPEAVTPSPEEAAPTGETAPPEEAKQAVEAEAVAEPWTAPPDEAEPSVEAEEVAAASEAAALAARDEAPTVTPPVAITPGAIEAPVHETRVPAARPSPAHARSPRRSRTAIVVGLALVAALIGAFVVGRAVTGDDPPRVGTTVPPPAVDPTLPPTPVVPPPGTVAVPDVTGLSAAEAQRELLRAGLMLSTVNPVEGEPGKVIRTDPAARTEVRPGASVALFIGAEPSRISPSPSAGG